MPVLRWHFFNMWENDSFHNCQLFNRIKYAKQLLCSARDKELYRWRMENGETNKCDAFQFLLFVSIKWPMCCCCINRDENNNVKWMKVRLKVPSTEFSHCVEALKMLFPFLYSPHWNPIMGQEQSYQTISLFCSSFMFIHLFTIVVFYPANLLLEIEDDKKGRWHDKKINKRIISLTIYLLK